MIVRSYPSREVRARILGRHCVVLAAAIGAVLCSESASQAQPPQDAPEAANQADAAGQENGERPGGAMPEMGMEGEAPEMREMARAMKSMADMCQMMMQREQQYRPYVMAAGGLVAALLVVALVLFIVLEVQWIRFWTARIKTERQKLGE